MTRCDLCGKGIIYGHLIRHTHTGLWEKRATKNPRVYKPNLHRGKVMVEGRVMRAKACASCLAKYRAPRAVQSAAAV